MSKFDWDKFNQIEKNLEELFIPKYFPGYTLSIYQNGKESYYSQKGYDDILNKIEYSRDSIFRIYSMTKPIVSTAMMQLIESNKISLDDALDVFAVHGLGGILGLLGAGIFATNGGIINGSFELFKDNLILIFSTMSYSLIVTIIILKFLDLIPGLGLRSSEVDEDKGLDISDHGERAYVADGAD